MTNEPMRRNGQACASDFIGGMDEVKPDPDQYELNDGDGTFVNVTEDGSVIDAELTPMLPHEPSEDEAV